jgi:hypothetical protein
MLENFAGGCRSSRIPFVIMAEAITTRARRITMNRAYCDPQEPSASELERVIEPLASYICATDQPRAALMAALALLFSEVNQTYRAANAQIAAFARSSCS